MPGLRSFGSAPLGLVLHVALAVTLGDLLNVPGLRLSQGVQPLSFFGAESAEPTVIGWTPAAAVYLRDPDGHQLEFLSMLDAEPRPSESFRGPSGQHPRNPRSPCNGRRSVADPLS